MADMIRTAGVTHGVDVGVIILDNNPPRPKGDVGNARTFDFPLHYEMAIGVEAESAVEDDAEGQLDEIVAAGRRLIRRGVRGITTCCGFLSIYQRELSEILEVPVASSSLLQISQVLRLLADDKKVGVITINGSTLSDRHLAGTGLRTDDKSRVVVFGLEDEAAHLYPVIQSGVGDLDIEQATRELVDTAVAAMTREPAIGAFVLECTNLPPYAQAIREATGLPVWDAVTLVNWFQQGWNA